MLGYTYYKTLKDIEEILKELRDSDYIEQEGFDMLEMALDLLSDLVEEE